MDFNFIKNSKDKRFEELEKKLIEFKLLTGLNLSSFLQLYKCGLIKIKTLNNHDIDDLAKAIDTAGITAVITLLKEVEE